MQKFFIIVALVTVVVASPAFGDLVGTIGIYFDVAAETNCHLAVPTIPFQAHVILTDLTVAEVHGVEFTYEIDVHPQVAWKLFRVSEELYGGINVSTADDVLSGEYVMGWPKPFFAAPATVLVTWELVVFGVFPANIHLGPPIFDPFADGLPHIFDGTDILPVGIVSGDPLVPVAMINDCMVAEETTSWGGIKAIFR